MLSRRVSRNAFIRIELEVTQRIADKVPGEIFKFNQQHFEVLFRTQELRDQIEFWAQFPALIAHRGSWSGVGCPWNEDIISPTQTQTHTNASMQIDSHINPVALLGKGACPMAFADRR